MNIMYGYIQEVPDGSVVRWASQDMKYIVNDLEVMGSNSGRVELGVHRTV